MTNRVHRAALEYARRGWPVFPCLPGTDFCVNPGGLAGASTDPAEIDDWFARLPQLNLAVATGYPGPDVLDLGDERDEDSFCATLHLYAGGFLDGAAATVETPGGGRHLYYRGTTQDTARLLDWGIGFHSTGGYVLAPPSVTQTGRYEGGTVTSHPGYLNWAAATRLLDLNRHPERDPEQPDYEPEGGS